jgi:serine/threonine protein kinase
MKKNLTKFLDESPCIHLEQKNKILLDIAEGLHHLHSQTPAIIHRDLTTSNVLLDSNGTAKISDFGNSRLVDMAAYLTRIPGTLDYMPPEALEGGKYNNKLDIFSFGHLSIYVIIQQRPHPLLGSNYKNAVGELIARTEVDRRQRYLHEVKSTIGGGESHPLYGLIIRCLQIEPSARPSSVNVITSLGAALIDINRRTPPASVAKSNILKNVVAISPINLAFITPRDVSAGTCITEHSHSLYRPTVRCLHNTSSATGSLQHSISGETIAINPSTFSISIPKPMRTSIPKNLVAITPINLAYITPKVFSLAEELHHPDSSFMSNPSPIGPERQAEMGTKSAPKDVLAIKGGLPSNTVVQPTGVLRGQRAYSEYGGLEESLYLPHTIVYSTGFVLGRGAYGDVLEVEYKGIKYAAKKYRFYTAPLGVFMREHDILSRVRHPNIVPYYGICKLASDKSTVIVMERMNSNLNTFLSGDKISLERKFHILNDVTNGLHHLHRQTPAIIHRDLTAGNVLLDSNGTAKISDFGNSRLVDLHATPELLTSNPGTLDYMPPEALESGEYNEKLDVFSFGHLSIHVLLQRRPHPLLRHTYKFEGKLTPRTEVERRQLYLDEMKSTLYLGGSHPLYCLVIQCLQDDPCRRPSCASILKHCPFVQLNQK